MTSINMENTENKTKENKEEEVRPEQIPENVGEGKPYAYIIKDKNFPDFYVLNSANAWWLDMGKVQTVFNSYKMDMNDEEVIGMAGISSDQLRYFRERHPEFSHIKQVCRNLIIAKAKRNVNKAIEDGSVEQSNWLLSRKRKDEYSTRQELSGPDGASLGIAEAIDNIAKLANGNRNTQVNTESIHSSGSAPSDTTEV